MYIGSWRIDDYLTFVCNSISPSTGDAKATDAPPTYRIYEDEGAAALLTGTMTDLDPGHTTGFYSEKVQLTALAGFEINKCYTIYIEASVESVVGTTIRTFTIEGGASGSGSSSFTYTLTNSVDGTPIAGAVVWASTDLAGANIIVYGLTDINGQVVFNLNPGTYYFWAKKPGFVDGGPDAEIVT